VITLRPAVNGDFEAVVGRPPPFRIKALTGVEDGKPVGIGGIGFQPDGTYVAFMSCNECARRYKVAMHRAALLTMNAAKSMGIKRLVALADPGIEKAEPWLLRLGFKPVEVAGERVFVWNSLR
jgi:hypothetical protein